MKAKVCVSVILIVMGVVCAQYVYSQSESGGWVVAGVLAWYFEEPTQEFEGYAWVGWDDMDDGTYKCEVRSDRFPYSDTDIGRIYGSDGANAEWWGDSFVEAESGIRGHDHGGTYHSDWDYVYES